MPDPDRFPPRDPAIVAMKDALRREALARRAALDPEARTAAAATLAAMADRLPLAPGAIVSGFHAIRGEIDVAPLLAALAARGHPLALPALVGADDMVFRAWTPDAALVPGTFGLREPPADAPERDPALLLVPLAAFDAAGNRIGYGRGYYDRALTRLDSGPARPTAVGVAFSVQEVAAIPAEPHDRPLDFILTETGLHAFSRV